MMNRTRNLFAATLCSAVTMAFLAFPNTLHARFIEVWKCGKPNPDTGGFYECWCMENHDTKETRKICNEGGGGGCWHDYGWVKEPLDVMPDPGGSLPVNYNSAGDMLISVAPGEGGNFFGTGNPYCLGFNSNSSNLVVIPAPLLQ